MKTVEEMDLGILRTLLVHFLDESDKLGLAIGNGPSEDSAAAEEIRTEGLEEWLALAFSQGDLQIEAARDHAMALNDLLLEPVETLASWTVLRGILESSALAAWLLAPEIGARERVARSLGFRYEGMDQQRRFVALVDDAVARERVEQRMAEILENAEKVGFERRLNRNEREIGVAMAFPGVTAIVRDALDEEKIYRLASAMAHAHPWAQHQLGYSALAGKGSSSDLRPVSLQKNMSTLVFVFLCRTAIKVLARSLWCKWHLNGWSTTDLRELVSGTFQEAGLSSNDLPWNLDKIDSPHPAGVGAGPE